MLLLPLQLHILLVLEMHKACRAPSLPLQIQPSPFPLKNGDTSKLCPWEPQLQKSNTACAAIGTFQRQRSP